MIDYKNFGEAIEAIKIGKRATREGWNGKDMFICLSPGSDNLDASKFWSFTMAKYVDKYMCGTANIRPLILLKTAQDDIVMGWSPSQSDVLAEDWYILD